jgi:hypothetical protein
MDTRNYLWKEFSVQVFYRKAPKKHRHRLSFDITQCRRCALKPSPRKWVLVREHFEVYMVDTSSNYEFTGREEQFVTPDPTKRLRIF